MRQGVLLAAALVTTAVGIGLPLTARGLDGKESSPSPARSPHTCLPSAAALDTPEGDIGWADEDCKVTLLAPTSVLEVTPALSPDRKRIAFVRFVGPAGRASELRAQLVVVDLESKDEEVLVNGGPGYVYTPSWSPDGTQLAFAYDDLGDGRPAIWVHDLTTDKQSLVSRGTTGQHAPRWSADGERLVFGRSGDPAALVIASAAGNGTEEIVAVDPGPSGRAFPGRAAWSPDGASLVVLHGEEDPEGGPISYRLVTVDEQGNVVARSDAIDGYVQSIVWTTSGIFAATQTETVAYDEALEVTRRAPVSVDFN